jgi:hypothetical protein
MRGAAPLAMDGRPWDDDLMPYRRLAMRVLDRALRDLAGCSESSTDRESARAFFADSAMLAHWCRVAALDPHWIARRAERLRPTYGADPGGPTVPLPNAPVTPIAIAVASATAARP